MQLKRFHLFISEGYYPMGFDDYQDSFETFEEAEAEGLRLLTNYNFVEIAEAQADGSLEKIYSRRTEIF